MRPVSFGPLAPNASTDRKLDWIIQPLREVAARVRLLREIENASVEDAIAVADSYSANSTFTPTRQVNVTSPTAANIAAVLASFLADLRKRGVKKST
jgi:DNA replicative helicase MCM subunit Mcm2 (Cdc46/Mcm family)